MPSRFRPTKRKRRAAFEAEAEAARAAALEATERAAALQVLERAVRRRRSLVVEGFLVV